MCCVVVKKISINNSNETRVDISHCSISIYWKWHVSIHILITHVCTLNFEKLMLIRVCILKKFHHTTEVITDHYRILYIFSTTLQSSIHRFHSLQPAIDIGSSLLFTFSMWTGRISYWEVVTTLFE